MDAAFDPEDTSWSSVSPGLAQMRRTVLVIVVTLVVAATALISWAVSLPLLGSAAAVLGVVALLWGWWWIGRNFRAWGYTERADDLLVRRGLAFRQLVVVPYGRMQYVDVTAGPVERRFGLVTVQLHTAAAATDARIPGLEPAEAARLRDRLAARGEARAAGL
jgi:membrane protein YdbS with pleckstrin-like domain